MQLEWVKTALKNHNFWRQISTTTTWTSSLSSISDEWERSCLTQDSWLVQVFTRASPNMQAHTPSLRVHPAHKHLIISTSSRCTAESNTSTATQRQRRFALSLFSSCHFGNDPQDKWIRRRRFNWQDMVQQNKIPHTKERNDTSSNWALTAAAAHQQSAALYSPRRMGMRWKWICLGVWVIGLGGPMVGDVSEARCALMTLSVEQGMELLFQAIPHSGRLW